MKKKRKAKQFSLEDLDHLFARKVAGSDLGQRYVHHMQNLKAQRAVKAGSMARNYQIQYGNMVEEINRLPLAMRADTLQRMQELGGRLDALKKLYPLNFPLGAMPGQNADQARRRLVM